MRDKIISTAKYAGTSISLGLAITQILVFCFPSIKEISEPIQALVIFGLNIALVKSGLITEE